MHFNHFAKPNAYKVVAFRNLSINLHKKDKSHPNQQGSYLAACVILGTILNVDITELPDKGFTLKSVTSEQAAYYQNLAQQHVESVEGSAP